MKAPLSYVPTLPAAAGLCTGIVLHSIGAALAGAIVACMTFVALLALRRKYTAYYALMVMIGVLTAHSHSRRPLPEHMLGSVRNVYAKIEDVHLSRKGYTYLVEIRQINSTKVNPALCRLAVLSFADPYEVGETVLFKGTVSPLESTSDLPFQADYTKYLRQQGIGYSALLHNYESVHLVKGCSAAQRLVNRAREAVSGAIASSPVQPDTKAFLLSIIIGDRSYLQPEVLSEFGALGIAHLLALSGLHVGVVVSLLIFLLFPLKAIRGGYTARSVLVLVLIWIYTVICGMGPSIMRAAVMSSVFIIVRFLQRGYAVYNTLLLSVIVILCARPMDLFTPGFQLSVCAVASIVTFSYIVPKQLKKYTILYFFLQLVLVPVWAVIGTGMLSAYYFHFFPPMFLIANLLTALVFPALLSCGVLLVLLRLCGMEGSILGSLTDFLYSLITGATDSLSNASVQPVSGLYFSAWLLLPYFLAVAALGWWVYRRRAYLVWLAGAMVAAVFVTADITKEKAPQAEMYILRSKGGTDIVMLSGTRALLLTTAAEARRTDILQAYRTSLAGFLAVRRCDSLSLCTDTLSLQHLKVAMPYIVAGDKVLYIADSDTIVKAGDTVPDYVVVCRGYKGTIGDLAKALAPDSILLSHDLGEKRKAALHGEDTCGYAVRDLTRGAWAWIQK